MSIISVSKLKTLLKLKGVRDTGFDDDELESLIEFKTLELQGLLGVNLEETLESQKVRNFKEDRIRLSMYPVQSIESVTLNNEEIDERLYYCDPEIGVVYFKHRLYGNLGVYYISCLPYTVLETVIAPLISDMILYDLTKKSQPGQGLISSIREGDVSINYDTNSSLGNQIQKRIEELQYRYAKTARVTLI